MRTSPRQSRRFSALDLVILMVATAAALVWLSRFEVLADRFLYGYEDGWISLFYIGIIPTTALVADPLLAAWTLAWCVLRWRTPRARWSRLVRNPGVCVGFVSVLAWLIGGIVTLSWGMDIHHGTPDSTAFGVVLLASSTIFCGFGIFVTWTGAVLAGRWRPEANWLDRMGRLLGIGWIVLAVPSNILLNVNIGTYY